MSQADSADRVALATDLLCLGHEPGSFHPESPARLRSILRLIERRGLPGRLLTLPGRDADQSELLRTHTEEHVDGVLSAAGERRSFDPDTHTSEGSVAASLRALGTTIALTQAICGGQVVRGFAAVRPPGHHATSGQAMGFCFFNNVAAAALAALEYDSIERVLIVDWDVHHGNGTQEIFQDDDRVLYFSTHRSPFYPGTGRCDDVFGGTNANAPLPAGFSDIDVVTAFQRLLVPLARAFAPDLILVSAGFDAHEDDPLGGCLVSEEGFISLAGLVHGLAARHCSGRWAAVLEGGYDLRATARCSVRTLEVMLDGDPEISRAGEPSALVRGILERTRRAVGRTDWGKRIEWSLNSSEG